MENKIISPLRAKSLKRQNRAALLLVWLFIFVTAGIIFLALDGLVADSGVINIAGKQRMYSREIIKETISLGTEHSNATEKNNHRDNLKKAEMALTKSHWGLQRGDVELSLPGKNSVKVEQLFNELNPIHEKIKENIDQIMALAPDELSSLSQDSNLIAGILKNSDSFFLGMDRIVKLYEEEARKKVSFTKKAAIIMFVLGMVLLITIERCYSTPLAENIEKASEELEARNERLTQLMIEVDQYANEMEQLADKRLKQLVHAEYGHHGNLMRRSRP